jgi:hypothetical protein
MQLDVTHAVECDSNPMVNGDVSPKLSFFLRVECLAQYANPSRGLNQTGVLAKIIF